MMNDLLHRSAFIVHRCVAALAPSSGHLSDFSNASPPLRSSEPRNPDVFCFPGFQEKLFRESPTKTIGKTALRAAHFSKRFSRYPSSRRFRSQIAE
jgi:hypothetical protein